MTLLAISITFNSTIIFLVGGRWYGSIEMVLLFYKPHGKNYMSDYSRVLKHRYECIIDLTNPIKATYIN